MEVHFCPKQIPEASSLGKGNARLGRFLKLPTIPAATIKDRGFCGLT
jgi:hypothetical protein